MLAIHIIGWFVFGFAVAAILLYGPALRKAYRVRAEGIVMMKDSNKRLRESAEMAKQCVLTQEKYGKLQDKHLELLAEYKALGEEMISERKEFTEFLRKYEALMIDHKALFWRAGGGVEGTA